MLVRDIKKVKLPDSYRVICIADIHGNFTAFIKLLSKVNYDIDKDYLFILGDLLERGREEEISTLDYIYELSKNEKVYIISGNNDRRIRFIQSEDCQHSLEWLKIRPGNILAQWAKIFGINDTEITEENYKNVIGMIKRKYQDEINFIINLPLVIETDEFICVHSALDSREDWWETSEWNAWFGNINEPNKTGKWVISGHAPTRLFPEAKVTYLPIMRHDNKTISIDGGSGCFFDAQLNALVIEKTDKNENIVFSYNWSDIFPQGIVTENVKTNYINEVYLYFQGMKSIEILKKGDYFTECKVINTGMSGLIKNEYIEGKGNIFEYWDTMANFVSVYKNEIVSVIDNSCKGYTYIRNSKSELGWIPKKTVNIFKSE
ncbi:MAG: metallophosphoesterase [Eubacteriales bacterium]|nr:metallophosphoesterase [Eubacteriales bacterium]